MYVGSVFLFGTRWYWGLTTERQKNSALQRSAEKIQLFGFINNQPIGVIFFFKFIPPGIKRVFFLNRVYD